MSVVTPPPQDELELLIREARARQRRRWILGAAAAAVSAAVALGAYAAVPGGGSAEQQAASGKSAAPTKPPRCRSDQLRLSVPKMWGAAAGTLIEWFTLTNTSNATCAVAGWPGVRRLDAAGHPIPMRIVRAVYVQSGPAPFRPVPLKPGATATFSALGEDWNHRLDRACPQAETLQVEPRGGGGWLSVAPPHGIPACRQWAVAPLTPGRISDWPNLSLSEFYSPPTSRHRYFAGKMNGTTWQLHVRDSGDGRYCFNVVTDGIPRGGRCGRFYGPGVAGKLGWVSRSGDPSFVAGAVVSAARHMAVKLSNGRVVYRQTMPPTRLLAPGISFFFTTIPHGRRVVSIQGSKDSGRLVVASKR